ncbi:hypothetical protein KL929_002628 [Ogataea haglerorum]|nr:hypothetical protein KL929_002628 [Ogataea haglerorum]
MIGYGVANIVAPQMWTTGPRYYAAWIVQLVVAWFFSSVLLIWIRVILSRRNKKRLAKLEFDDDGNIISKKNAFVEDGGDDRRKVDVSMLDLTDLEMKSLYILYSVLFMSRALLMGLDIKKNKVANFIMSFN